MIRVKLGKAWCETLIRDGSLPVEWLARLARPVEKVARGNGESWLIEASPREWDDLLAWGHRRQSVPFGASDSDEKFALVVKKVVERVETNLGRMSRHPAYQGRAVKAHSAVVLPAFRCKHPRARWWPTPRMAIQNAEGDSLELESGWLVPEIKQVRGWTVTKWHLDHEAPAH